MRARSWAGALVLGAVLLAPPAASAHAFLVRSTPAGGASLRVAPARVVLTFDEPVSPARMHVTRTDGVSVLAGKPTQPRGAPTQIVLPLRRGLAHGGYIVSWSEVDADDGHLISGTFSFAVGKGVKAPAVSSSSGSDFRFEDAAARWLMLVGLLVAGGVVSFRRLVGAGERERRFVLAASAAATVAAVGAAILLDRQPGALTTRFDHITLAAAAVAAFAAVAGLTSLRLPALRLPADLAALALLAAPTLDGHASAPGESHLLSIPADLVHVASASVWVGGVFALAVIVPRPALPGAVRRFAPLAVVAVAALALTGIARAVGELKAVSQLWSTSYGETILVKSVLFTGLVAVAARARGRPGRRTIRVEAAVLFAAVAAAAVLIGLRPGRDVRPAAAAAVPAPPAFVTAVEAGPYAVGVSLVPEPSSVDAEATVLGLDGPVAGLDIAFRTGGRLVPATACGPGCYRAALPVEQPRSLAVRVSRRGKLVADASLRVPQEWPSPSAGTVVAKASSVFRRLRTLTIVSHLASAPGVATTTIYKMAAPNRLSGVELGSKAAEVILGNRRWDRDSGSEPWVPSAAVPVQEPSLPWPGVIRDAHFVGDGVVKGRPVWIVSFVDPTTPAWFRIAVDKQTGRTYSMDMVATAHFMHEDYRGFDAPTTIVAPH